MSIRGDVCRATVRGREQPSFPSLPLVPSRVLKTEEAPSMATSRTSVVPTYTPHKYLFLLWFFSSSVHYSTGCGHCVKEDS